LQLRVRPLWSSAQLKWRSNKRRKTQGNTATVAGCGCVPEVLWSLRKRILQEISSGKYSSATFHSTACECTSCPICLEKSQRLDFSWFQLSACGTVSHCGTYERSTSNPLQIDDGCAERASAKLKGQARATRTTASQKLARWMKGERAIVKRKV
jgi:hypothetical protein